MTRLRIHVDDRIAHGIEDSTKTCVQGVCNVSFFFVFFFENPTGLKNVRATWSQTKRFGNVGTYRQKSRSDSALTKQSEIYN